MPFAATNDTSRATSGPPSLSLSLRLFVRVTPAPLVPRKLVPRNWPLETGSPEAPCPRTHCVRESLGRNHPNSGLAVIDPMTHRPRSGTQVSAWILGCVCATVALFAISLWLGQSLPFDDAYISFRYADNFRVGDGLVFNPGERVEGFSNPLFVVLLVIGRTAGLSYLLSAQLISLVSMVLVLLVCSAWARELAREHVVTAAPLQGGLKAGFGAEPAPLAATAWVVLHPSSQLYLTSGMETWLFVALVIGFAFTLRRRVQTPARALIVGVFATLLAVTRPEGLAAVAVGGVVVAWDLWLAKERWRWRVLAAFAALPIVVLGSLLTVRLGYYGLPLPNTYYAKLGSTGFHRWSRGLEYVAREAVWLAPPLLLLGVTFEKIGRPVVALLGVVVVSIGFSVYSGGDWMPGSRFLLPAMVALAPLVGVGSLWLWRSLFGRRESERRGIWPGVVAVVGLLLLLGHLLQAQMETVRLERREADWIRVFGGVARQLASEDKDLEVATGGIGIVAFEGDLRVLDVFGLTEPAIARDGRWAPRGTSGHQSYNGDFVWSRRPDVLLPHSVVTDAPLDETSFITTVTTAPEPNRFWMQEMVARPEFSTLYQYRVFEPLPGRFVGGFEIASARR